PLRSPRQDPLTRAGISPVRGSRVPLISIEYLGIVVQGPRVTTGSFYCERGSQGQAGVDPGLSILLVTRPAGPTHNQGACRSSGDQHAKYRTCEATAATHP